MLQTLDPATREIVHLPWGASPEEVMAVMDRDGVLIFDDVLSTDQIAQVNADLDPHLASLQAGSLKDDEIVKEFHGDKTKRLTNIVSISKTFRDAVLGHPTTLGYVRAVYAGVSDSFWLNTAQVIELMPGEDLQILHRDVGNYPVFATFGPDGPEVMVNLIVALVDATDENGATRIIPGSHKWPFDREFSQEMTVPAAMKAGSAVFYSGKTVHGGGANRTVNTPRRVIGCPYNPGFLVPEEAYPFTVPLDVAREMTPEMQQLIGFRSIHQKNPAGGSLWQHNYEELADFLGL
ncbi:MAG: phytanoyl-CoA dioxygenase family protein [Sphingopyxis sp.]|nr:phytanoyl-CoA dioxygenase family protein [Sphingopyxis sp.]